MVHAQTTAMDEANVTQTVNVFAMKTIEIRPIVSEVWCSLIFSFDRLIFAQDLVHMVQRGLEKRMR